MSTISNKQPLPEFDYWEFVHCAVCFLPFAPDAKDIISHPPTVPFWLTECGHTLCNTHLKSDQSCAACGASNIQLVPLQRELSPPMNEWFRPLCRTLDNVSATVRFQQDTMAALVRFYKGKCMQQRATINKAREVAIENKALRSQIEQLQQENLRLRQATAVNDNNLGPRFDHVRSHSFGESTSYEAGDFRNVNGKRPMIPAQGFLQNSSSPHRIVTTPVPPSRLTLPVDHQQPESRNERFVDNNENRGSLNNSNSSRFGQFAYQPPQTPSRPPMLQQQFNFRPQNSTMPDPRDDSNNLQHESRRQQPQQRSMPPPPPPMHRQPPLNDPVRSTRGQFRPASTSMLSRTNTSSERFHGNSANASSVSGIPMTPSTNRFFAPRPQVADLNRNAHPSSASGTRTPFIPR